MKAVVSKKGKTMKEIVAVQAVSGIHHIKYSSPMEECSPYVP